MSALLLDGQETVDEKAGIMRCKHAKLVRLGCSTNTIVAFSSALRPLELISCWNGVWGRECKKTDQISEEKCLSLNEGKTLQ